MQYFSKLKLDKQREKRSARVPYFISTDRTALYECYQMSNITWLPQYWQPEVFPAARINLYCLCYLYNMCSLIGITLWFYYEKDGLVLQPYNQKLGCPGFFL